MPNLQGDWTTSNTVYIPIWAIRKFIKFNEKLRWGNDENTIDFRWSDDEEDDTAKANLVESFQKKVNEEIFNKLLTG